MRSALRVPPRVCGAHIVLFAWHTASGWYYLAAPARPRRAASRAFLDRKCVRATALQIESAFDRKPCRASGLAEHLAALL